MIMYAVQEEALDHRGDSAGIVADADIGRVVQDRVEGVTRRTLASERFLGSYHATQLRLRRGHERTARRLPAGHAGGDRANFRCGDAILIDTESRRIVGRDGAAPISGEIVTIESRPPEHPRHAVIHQRDQLELVRLQRPDRSDGRLSARRSGAVRLRSQVRTGSGHDAQQWRGAVGSPSIAGSRSARGHWIATSDRGRDPRTLRGGVEQPHWWRALRIRSRCSYLWVGGTGTGKSYHLKLLTNEIHDLVESWTGIRSSRLVMLDASDFWAPYFGETEQRISRWAAKLEQLGSQALTCRDGGTSTSRC